MFFSFGNSGLTILKYLNLRRNLLLQKGGYYRKVLSISPFTPPAQQMQSWFSALHCQLQARYFFLPTTLSFTCIHIIFLPNHVFGRWFLSIQFLKMPCVLISCPFDWMWFTKIVYVKILFQNNKNYFFFHCWLLKIIYINYRRIMCFCE